MEYLHYFIIIIYDGLEDFIKSFSIVSGKLTLRVWIYSIVYLIISIIGHFTNKFTFASIPSAVIACVFLFLVNCISNIQFKDIEKFKNILKGEETK